MSVQVERSETDRARYVFKVSQYSDKTPWIFTEPVDGKLKILASQDGFLGFDLREGTTFEQAQEIARLMNEKITEITCTTSPGGYDKVR